MSSFGRTTFLEFQKHSVPVHMLAEYWYCAAQIPNRRLQGDIETPTLLEGREIHESDARNILAKLGKLRRVKAKTVLDMMLLSYGNIMWALKRKAVLANAEGRTLFVTILPELGILGKPDRVDCSNGVTPIIIETKTRDELPRRIWPDHELQVATYVLGLERLNFHPTHGVLEYTIRSDPSRRRRHTILLEEHLREKILSTAKTVVNLLLQKEAPMPTKNPRKCVKCRFCESCRWKPTTDMDLKKIADLQD